MGTLELLTLALVVVNFLLVCATGFYAYSAWQTWKEMKKERRISFLERRIEKLYTLILIKEKLIEESKNTRRAIHNGPTEGYITNLIDTIEKYQYLADDIMRKYIEIWIKFMRDTSSISEEFYESEDGKNFLEAVEKIVPQARSDIDKFQKEIKSLLN